MDMVAFWGVALVIFIIVEAATVGIVSIWFALGSLAALICAALGGALWLQIGWFLVISAVTLGFTRPLAKKYVNGRATPTNADKNVGQQGIVTETIDNIRATGTVKLSGKLWTARSGAGEIIPEGTLVVAVAIEGVKLIVLEAREREAATEEIK